MSEQRSAPRGTHRAPTGRSALGTGARPASGMGAVLQESEFSAADAIGGWRGAIESVVPTLLFVVLFMATRSIAIAGVAAVAACAIAVIVRLAQRQSVGSAVGGLLGVGIGAVWAVRSGSGTDFYLPGILTNAATLAIVLISILARRPLVGFIAALFDPRVADWAEDPDARRTYTRATWLLVALYGAKTLAQSVLFLAGAVAALGVVKLAMGLPLFALVVWIIWSMHRALLHRRAAAGETELSPAG